MNIVSKLTLRHLQQNKKRAVVTTLGIVAATALITALLLGIASFFSYFGEVDIANTGHWHAEYRGLTKEQVNALKEDNRVSSVAVYDADLEGCGVRMHSDKHIRYQLGNLRSSDAKGIETKVVCDYDGVLPVNAGEIAIEEQFLKDNGLDIKPGDTITYTIGNRYLFNPDGSKLYIAGNYNSNEGFDEISDVTVKVTAILHGNTSTVGYDILSCMGDKVPEENFVSICLKKCDFRAHKMINEISRDHGLEVYHYNTEFLISVFSINLKGGGIAAMFNLGLGALVIIMGTAIILIYNAFGMSLTERMKYLGMLASVGATRKQKRASIYFEGFLLAIIGIPVGMLAGYIGAYFTLSVLGKEMIKSHMIAGAEAVNKNVTVSAPLYIYVLIVLLALLTIFISAFVPAAKASKIMPIEAIRQSSTIKVKARSLRINPLIRKIFGFEGEIAYKNIKRNGAKGRVITLSIAASVVMFLTIIFFTDAFNKANSFEFDVPYQLYATCAVEDADELREIMESYDETIRCYASDMIMFSYKPDPNDPNYVQPNDAILNPDFLEKNYKNVFNSRVIAVATVDDEDFKDLLTKNGIDPASYFEGEIKGVILNDFYREKSKKSVFNEGIIGQKVCYDVEEGNTPSITIAGMVPYDKEDYIFKLVPKNTVAVFVPASRYYTKSVETLGADIATESIGIQTNSADKLFEEMQKLYEEDTIKNFTCGNLQSDAAVMQTVMFILKTVMYGFTILITLIALANMVNTISTGIIMRRKEFAMLRSVGLTEKGFKRMISMETILYGVRALVAGIPLSIILSYLISRKANSQIPFELNGSMYLLVIIVVFIIIGLSMLMSVSKIKNDEIIEVLKEDIC